MLGSGEKLGRDAADGERASDSGRTSEEGNGRLGGERVSWEEREGERGERERERERERRMERSRPGWRRGGGGEFGKGRSGTWATHYLLTSLLRDSHAAPSMPLT